MKRAVIENVIACLHEGQAPELDPEVFSSVEPDKLCEIAAGLTTADIPVFERALRAIDERDLAWMGFKIVLDPAVAVTNVDNEVTKKFGEKGSASGDSFIFFANDAKEIVCAHEYSGRDLMQMKDVTRGPAMHNEQFDGLILQATRITWA